MEWKDRICVGWMRVLCGSLLGAGMRADAKARQQSGERGTSGTRAVGWIWEMSRGGGMEEGSRTHVLSMGCGSLWRTYDLGETSTMHTKE